MDRGAIPSECAVTIASLAPELVNAILSYLDPVDLVRFGCSCRFAHAFIHPENRLTWKHSFLHVWDDPQVAWNMLTPTARRLNRQLEQEWDWFEVTRRRYAAYRSVIRMKEPKGESITKQNVVRPGTNHGNGDFGFGFKFPEDAVKTLLGVLETASYTDYEDGRKSLNINWLVSLFNTDAQFERLVHDYDDRGCQALPPLMDKSGKEFAGRVTRSMVARGVPDWASQFHIFYGPTAREENSLAAKAAARAIVYDWTVTGPEADYGPFLRNGSGETNWECLEAISSLMNRVFEGARSDIHRTPCTFHDAVTYNLRVDPSFKDDWAGLERDWVGAYAFLDYRALIHYNYANNLEYPMDLGQYEEACGDIMRLELKLDDSEDLREDPKLQTMLPVCRDLPVLYFSGTSSGHPHGQPRVQVRGTVSLIPGGKQVRWRYIITYAGADQWQLEGIQPGGIRSGGVYGLWSHVERVDDIDDQNQGPQGPFCYFPLERCMSIRFMEANARVERPAYFYQ